MLMSSPRLIRLWLYSGRIVALCRVPGCQELRQPIVVYGHTESENTHMEQNIIRCEEIFYLIGATESLGRRIYRIHE